MTFVLEVREAVGDDRPLLLAGTGLIVLSRDGRLLLQRRSDDDTWSLVGGYLEIGEAPEDAARREAQEEVGLDLGDLELFGVFAGPELYHDYDQGRVYSVTIAYVARDVSDEPKADHDEVKATRFFSLDALPEKLEHVTRPLIERFIEAERAR